MSEFKNSWELFNECQLISQSTLLDLFRSHHELSTLPEAFQRNIFMNYSDTTKHLPFVFVSVNVRNTFFICIILYCNSLVYV